MSKLVNLGPAQGWEGHVKTRLHIWVEPEPGEGKTHSKVFITEQPVDAAGALSAEARQDISEFWSYAVDRLKDLTQAVIERRSPAQAVVVVHGVGEQLPGTTLSRFVDAVVTDRYTFEPRGVISVKGKGDMETWLLNGRA